MADIGSSDRARSFILGALPLAAILVPVTAEIIPMNTRNLERR